MPSFGVVVLCRDDENRYAFVVGANGWSLPEANLESTETHLETAIRLLQEAGESIVVTGILRVLLSDDQILFVLAAIPSADAPARLLPQRNFMKGKDLKENEKEAGVKYFSIENTEKEIGSQVAERLREWVEAPGVRVWHLEMFESFLQTEMAPDRILFRFVPRCQKRGVYLVRQKTSQAGEATDPFLSIPWDDSTPLSVESLSEIMANSFLSPGKCPPSVLLGGVVSVDYAINDEPSEGEPLKGELILTFSGEIMGEIEEDSVGLFAVSFQEAVLDETVGGVIDLVERGQVVPLASPHSLSSPPFLPKTRACLLVDVDGTLSSSSGGAICFNNDLIDRLRERKEEEDAEIVLFTSYLVQFNLRMNVAAGNTRWHVLRHLEERGVKVEKVITTGSPYAERMGWEGEVGVQEEEGEEREEKPKKGEKSSKKRDQKEEREKKKTGEGEGKKKEKEKEKEKKENAKTNKSSKNTHPAFGRYYFDFIEKIEKEGSRLHSKSNLTEFDHFVTQHQNVELPFLSVRCPSTRDSVLALREEYRVFPSTYCHKSGKEEMFRYVLREFGGEKGEKGGKENVWFHIFDDKVEVLKVAARLWWAENAPLSWEHIIFRPKEGGMGVGESSGSKILEDKDKGEKEKRCPVQ